jgi:two-component system, NarL family, response regulator NreC
MPALNGLEATREIRRIVPPIRVILLSQHNIPEIMQQASNAGAHGYVIKSAISTELVSALHKVSSGHTAFPRNFRNSR